ncbi:methyltransferase domain-containing protein [Acidobacteria bacterium AB60]|nr:methyltransferase domain-containing protein [Acidobacteria bacterium AB60]
MPVQTPGAIIMTEPQSYFHAALVKDQFTRQARGFSESPELHNDAVLSLLVKAARPEPSDRALDVACGPGTVVAALSSHVASVDGLDATEAMLREAKALAECKALANARFRRGSVYALPYPADSFQIVTCRFAFHHFEDPKAAFSEMARVSSRGARIILCDAIAPDQKEKADAFNEMERFRDPSTVEFRTVGFLRHLFIAAGLGEPSVEQFQIPYVAQELVARSFPANGDRQGLLGLIEASVEGDRLGMNARRTANGIRIAFQGVVLSARR